MTFTGQFQGIQSVLRFSRISSHLTILQECNTLYTWYDTNFLSDHFEQDRSSLIKRSLKELFEDIIDKQIISEFEVKERKGKINFIDSQEIIATLKPGTKPR